MNNKEEGKNEPIFFGHNMGDLISQGMLNQKTELSHKPSLKELSDRSSLKKTAK